VKAFHPMTIGVMYPVAILKENEDDTCEVLFPTVGKRRVYRIPRNHIYNADGKGHLKKD
jgi:hypothetical protein